MRCSPAASEEKFDFEATGVDGWAPSHGQWAVEDIAGAPSGKKVLVQRATRNEYAVIVAPSGPYTAVDVSMKFKPISGREDASGGIVFRVTDGKYYVVRANALEDNFRLYTYDRGRRQIASARVKPPALGEWHSMRVVAVGDQMQAWLDGALSRLIATPSRIQGGACVGLWTKGRPPINPRSRRSDDPRRVRMEASENHREYSQLSAPLDFKS